MADGQPAARDALFAGSIPEYYHRHLGPLLFAGYAGDLAGRLRSLPANDASVLELAAGTGILTERLRRHLPPEVRLTATDLNAPMLDVAQRRMAGAGAAGITWKVADAGSLPFRDECFDAVDLPVRRDVLPRQAAGGAGDLPGAPAVGPVAVQCLGLVGGELVCADRARGDRRVLPRRSAAVLPGALRVPRSGGTAPVGARRRVSRARDHHPEPHRGAPSAAEAAIGIVRGNPVIAAIEERGGDPEAIIRKVAESLARVFGDYPLRMPTCVRVVAAYRPKFESKNRSATSNRR